MSKQKVLQEKEVPPVVLPDFDEIDVKPEDGMYPVERAFYLKVCKGPGVIIPSGAIVRLTTNSD
jgi:hypothetical protein